MISKLLHWVTAAVILFMLGYGIYMTKFITDIFEKIGPYQTHKSWGFIAFILIVIRIIWRISHRIRPSLPEAKHAWERPAVHITHAALYILMLIMPLSGWLMSSASLLQDVYGVKNMVFGLFEMPDPFQPGSETLTDLFKEVHQIASKLLIAVIITHILGVIYHATIRKDEVLKMMLPNFMSTKKSDP